MTAGSKRTILVLFNACREGLPMRPANEAHLMAWGRYSRHRVVYVNVAYAVPWRLIRRAKIDAVVFDTTFCSMHWAPAYFAERSALCLPVAGMNCPKIAIVQDEFANIDLVADFLKSVGVTHVLTCSEERDWAAFYPRLVGTGVAFRTVLTAYVDPQRATVAGLPASRRPVAIGYRGGHNPFWLGRQGVLKTVLADAVRSAAAKRGLTTDIEHPAAAAYLKGDAWFSFLRSCRSVLGAEGGASINDHDGSIRDAVAAYLEAHPQAGFEEVRAACFADRDGEVRLACLSPRHLEAAATRTAQLLVEGSYSGVLEPWRHYIPLKADGSNLDEALTALMDDALVDAMTDRAYADVVASGRWSYPAFIADLETSIIESGATHAGPRSIVAIAAARLLQARAVLFWRFAHIEASPAFVRGVERIALAARRIESAGLAGGLIRRLRRRARRLLGIGKSGSG